MYLHRGCFFEFLQKSAVIIAINHNLVLCKYSTTVSSVSEKKLKRFFLNQVLATKLPDVIPDLMATQKDGIQCCQFSRFSTFLSLKVGTNQRDEVIRLQF